MKLQTRKEKTNFRTERRFIKFNSSSIHRSGHQKEAIFGVPLRTPEHPVYTHSVNNKKPSHCHPLTTHGIIQSFAGSQTFKRTHCTTLGVNNGDRLYLLFPRGVREVTDLLGKTEDTAL